MVPLAHFKMSLERRASDSGGNVSAGYTL